MARASPTKLFMELKPQNTTSGVKFSHSKWALVMHRRISVKSRRTVRRSCLCKDLSCPTLPQLEPTPRSSSQGGELYVHQKYLGAPPCSPTLRLPLHASLSLSLLLFLFHEQLELSTKLIKEKEGRGKKGRGQ